MIKKLLLFLTLSFGASLVLAGKVPPNTLAIWSIFSGLFPVFVIGNLLLIFTWLIRKSFWLLLPMAALFFTKGSVQQYVGWQCGSDAVDAFKVEVGTFNLFGLRKVKTAESREMEDHLKNEVENLNLDIICFQENNPYSSKRMDEHVLHQLPNDYSSAGVRILSKHAIADKGTFDFNSHINGCIWADIVMGKEKIRVYCAHFKSNMVSSKADQVLQDGNLVEKKTWLDIRHMMGRYKRASIVRLEQAEMVKEHIQRSPYPVLICGDFNDHPLSKTVADLSIGFSDTFVSKGCGWGTTYGGSLPLLRIDYILADQRWEVIDHTIYPSDISDHHLVTSVLSLKE